MILAVPPVTSVIPSIPNSLKIEPPKLLVPIPNGKIRLYCVGIYFYNDVDFLPDAGFQFSNTTKLPAGTPVMPGSYILAAAAKNFGLRYSLSEHSAHVEYLSFTPQNDSPFRHPTTAPEFPFYGQPLTLQEVQAPIGSASRIFQYTCDKMVATPLEQNAQFGSNGFQQGSEIRIRLLSIYDSASLYN